MNKWGQLGCWNCERSWLGNTSEGQGLRLTFLSPYISQLVLISGFRKDWVSSLQAPLGPRRWSSCQANGIAMITRLINSIRYACASPASSAITQANRTVLFVCLKSYFGAEWKWSIRWNCSQWSCREISGFWKYSGSVCKVG